MLSRRFSIWLIALCCAANAGAQTVNDPDWVVTPLLPGGSLSQPTTMAFIGENDFLVLEKGTGIVKRVTNGAVSATNAIDLPVVGNSERGLLGIAVHPNFGQSGQPNNDKIYLYYSRGSSANDMGSWVENRLSRFSWNGATLSDETVLGVFGGAADGGGGPNHDGGPIKFGPDGKLYGITGDLNRNFAEQNIQGQASNSAHVGGVYRLNDDGSIPSNNPFGTHATADFHRWYAYGVRNSFGIDFDPANGNLWDTENGPGSYDEVNLMAPGFNSGWERIMGPDSRDPEGVGDLVNLAPGGVSTYSDPEFSWFAPVAPTAIHFLHGSSLGPSYDNKVLVGDNNNGNLYLFTLNAARDGFVLTGDLADLVADNTAERNQARFGTNFGVVTDIVRAPDGSLYVVNLGAGTVYRLTSTVVPGDFDGDNDVDGADFVIWQTHFPTTGGASLADGDADGDGDVDGADFVVWQTHFPTTPSPGAPPVPEPASVGLALLAAIGLLCHFRSITAGATGKRSLPVEKCEMT